MTNHDDENKKEQWRDRDQVVLLMKMDDDAQKGGGSKSFAVMLCFFSVWNPGKSVSFESRILDSGTPVLPSNCRLRALFR
jgi:hypothetical protein